MHTRRTEHHLPVPEPIVADVIGRGDEDDVLELIEKFACCHVVDSRESARTADGYSDLEWCERSLEVSSILVDVTASCVPLKSSWMTAGNPATDGVDFQVTRSRVFTSGKKVYAEYEVTT